MPTDPEAKLRRAYAHMGDLEALIGDFARGAYAIDMTPDYWEDLTAPDAVGDVIIWAEATAQPPSEVWGPIIGDVVHNLRSALDQLIWGLSVEFEGSEAPPPDPIPSGSPWRGVRFPVCLTSAAWDAAATRNLWAIDPLLLSRLEALQPSCTGAEMPDREPLAVLQELWNIDKHRHLHLVNAIGGLHELQSVTPFAGAPDLKFEIVSKREMGPLVGRTEIGRARLIPGEWIAVTLPQWHIDPIVAINVAFDQGPPAYGSRVLDTLVRISQTVEGILAAF
jgi:hypothetical protein